MAISSSKTAPNEKPGRSIPLDAGASFRKTDDAVNIKSGASS